MKRTSGAASKDLAIMCDELRNIVEQELKLGNKITQGPEISNWPERGDVFVHLEADLQLKNYDISPLIDYAICSDKHFGWNDECRCSIHGNLLVAGMTHLPE